MDLRKRMRSFQDNQTHYSNNRVLNAELRANAAFKGVKLPKLARYAHQIRMSIGRPAIVRTSQGYMNTSNGRVFKNRDALLGNMSRNWLDVTPVLVNYVGAVPRNRNVVPAGFKYSRRAEILRNKAARKITALFRWAHAHPEQMHMKRVLRNERIRLSVPRNYEKYRRELAEYLSGPNLPRNRYASKTPALHYAKVPAGIR
jgi:hypothetical protein